MIKVMTMAALLTGSAAVAQSVNPAPYCDASFDDVDGTMPVGDAIKNVSFGTLANNSGGQYAAPHYVHYSNLPTASFQKGSTYNLVLTFYVGGGCGYGAWIDYDQDNQFEESERITGNTSYLDLGDNTQITASITIPSSAMTGNTRMRIRIVEDDNYNAQYNFVEAPCNASTSATDVMDWGETEDYTINISGNAGLSESLETDLYSYTENKFRLLTEDAATMSLVNMNGQVLITTTEKMMDLTNFNTGVYLIRVQMHSGEVKQVKISK